MSNLPLNLVYLDPDQPGIPVDYIRSIEKAGMVALPQKYLAMYTLGGNPSIGPAGPPGPAGEPYLWDTVIASASAEYTALEVDAVTPATHFRAPFPITAEYVRASLSIAPTGAPVIIDVHMNGVTMFSSPIQIDIGSKTSVGSIAPSVLALTAVPDDAEFTVFILQVGSLVTGSGVKVAVTGKKVLAL